LPVRTGEAAFPLLMRRVFGVEIAVSLPALLWFRCLDAHALGAVAWVVLAPVRLGPAIAAAVLVLWLPLPLAAYAGRRLLLARLQGRTGRLAALLRRMADGISADTGALAHAVGWTAGNWAAKLAACAWLLGRLADLSPGEAVLGTLGGEVSSVLPLHGVAGAGTYEAGVVAMLLPLGIPIERSLGAAVNLHLLILGASLVGLAVAVAAGAGRAGDEARATRGRSAPTAARAGSEKP
jgi:hypothetical protein